MSKNRHRILQLFASGLFSGGLPTLTEFLLHDTFSVDDAAPMEASTSVTGGKRVKALDTNNNGSVSGGKMLLTGTSAANFTNPAYYWTDSDDAGFPVVDGLAVGMVVRSTSANTNQAMSCGCHADTTPAGNQAYHWYHSSGGGLVAYAPTSTTVGSWTFATTYGLVQAFNDDHILFYRHNGTDWILERNVAITYPSVIYPTVTGVVTTTGWTFDDVTVSQAANPSVFDSTMAEDTTLNSTDHAALIAVLNAIVFF